jgi:16S rRNA (guanine1207-N2)-methyltransferase
VLDLGCGCGIAGLLVAAAMHRLAAGTPVPGDVLLVDSNARAVACATAGAAMNGFAFVRVAHDDRWQPVAAEFDLVLGNPPYFAAGRIAEAFTDTAWRALRPAGRLLLVSKHGAALAEAAAARGFAVEARRRRGYDLTLATRPGAGDP